MCSHWMVLPEVVLCEDPFCQPMDRDDEIEDCWLEIRRLASQIEQSVVCSSRYEASQRQDCYGLQQ